MTHRTPCSSVLSRLVPTAALTLLSACSGQIDETASNLDGPAAPVGMQGPSGGQPNPAPPGGAGGQAPPSAPPPLAMPNPNLLPSDSLFACRAGAQEVSPRRAVRLTPAQYDNTIRALIGARKVSLVNPFKGVQSTERFSTAAPFGMAEVPLNQHLQNASAVAAAVLPDLMAKSPCLGEAVITETCARGALGAFAEAAFRRPLTAEEATRFGGLVAANASLGKGAIELGLEAIIASPRFLFRFELGEGQPGAQGRVRISPFEVASALSYTLTDAPPDTQLMEAAKRGELARPDQIAQQVRRLLGEPGKSPTLLRFFREYLRYDETIEVFKDPKEFPGHKPERLVEDTDELIRSVLAEKSVLRALLTADHGFARASTMSSYGLAALAGDVPQRVKFPAGQRAGILTQPSFLTSFSKADQNDPIHRGKFVLESLLCGAVPPLTLENVPDPPDLGPTSTLRDRLAAHVSNPSCAGCHKLMDPLGFPFEGYDHVGRHRTTESGRPVNDTGALSGAGPGLDGPIKGAIELQAKLAASPEVERCFVRHAFRFFTGRNEATTDACALSEARAAHERGDMVGVVAALLSSDAFLHRRAE